MTPCRKSNKLFPHGYNFPIRKSVFVLKLNNMVPLSAPWGTLHPRAPSCCAGWSRSHVILKGRSLVLTEVQPQPKKHASTELILTLNTAISSTNTAGQCHQRGLREGVRLLPRNSQAQEFKKLSVGLCPPAAYICSAFRSAHCPASSSRLHVSGPPLRASPWGR